MEITSWYSISARRRSETSLAASGFICRNFDQKMRVELNVSSKMGLGARRSGSAMKPEINATCRFTQKTPRV